MTGMTLESMVKSVGCLREVLRKDLETGNGIFVKTRNSTYHIRAGENGAFIVSGGWFDLNGHSPITTTIRGCTWGGTAIKTDIIAACGLRIEFGNRLITSPIEKIFVFSRGAGN